MRWLVVVVGIVTGWLVGRYCGREVEVVESVKVERRVDTVFVREPRPVSVTVTARPVVREDTVVRMDTVVQHHYRDTLYEAWVSGPVAPRLDSIRVYNRTVTVTRPAPRWSLGVGAGIALTAEGRVSPAIIVGVSYRLWP